MSQLEAALRFHRENQIPIAHNIFRPHSENYYKLFEYARQMKESATAQLRKRSKDSVARPKAEKNILSTDPRMQQI